MNDERPHRSRLEFGGIGEIIGPENSRNGSVKYRIAMWASAGFLVAGCWNLYVLAMAPIQIPSAEPIVWTLVRLTCPVVFASFYFHFGLYFYWVLFANAATYAWVGLIVETLRLQFRRAQ
jgi:hypothetical protein